MVMFMPARTSTTYPMLRAVRNVAVSVLHRSQAELAGRFAARSTDRWQGVEWHIGGTGAPHLDGAMGWLDCTITAEYEAGDHLAVLAEVTAIALGRAEEPLIYFWSGFGGFQE